MNRTEANMKIGTETWRLGTLLKTSGEIFFENILKWSLLAAIVYIPPVFVIQLILLRMPPLDAEAFSAALESMDLSALAALDFSPLLISYGLQLLLSLYTTVLVMGTVEYVNIWLQPEKTLPSVGTILLTALKRWPAAILLTVIFFVSLMICGMVGAMLVVLMLPVIAAMILFAIPVYNYALVATAIRRTFGFGAISYSIKMIRRRIWRNIGVVLLFVLISFLFGQLLEAATSAFYAPEGTEILMSLVSAVINVVSGLASIFMTIGVTLGFINQEQLQL